MSVHHQESANREYYIKYSDIISIAAEWHDWYAKIPKWLRWYLNWFYPEMDFIYRRSKKAFEVL